MIRFFDRHDWLLTDPELGGEARRQLGMHRRSLVTTKKRQAAVARQLKRVAARAMKRDQARQLTSLRNAPPRTAICQVFGGRHCEDALAVAHCESRMRPTAQNGQYRGLFQMGSSERRRYGHGSSPYDQAKAAHRYFVASGRDWSPWTCKPWR